MKDIDNRLLFDKLLQHRFHNVEIAAYGDPNGPESVCLECMDCGEVILDAELYTLLARGDVDG